MVIVGLLLLVGGGYLASTSVVVAGSVVPNQQPLNVVPLTLTSGDCTLTWSTPPIAAFLNGNTYAPGAEIAVTGNINAQTSGTCNIANFEILGDWLQTSPPAGQNPLYAVFTANLNGFATPYSFSFQAPTVPGAYTFSDQIEPINAGNCISDAYGCGTFSLSFTVSAQSTTTSSTTTTVSSTATTTNQSTTTVTNPTDLIAGGLSAFVGLIVLGVGFSRRAVG
jgi:hypothetical protein